MIVMLDTCEQQLADAKVELHCEVEQLLTPLTRYALRSERFAVDNGSFSRFDRDAFLALLQREKANKARCRFVALPDVVESARRTLELFHYWRHRIGNWPLALVAQDGQENLDIPWSQIAAVFIGGSTGWKLSKHAADVIKTAKAIGKWVHVGRVNTPGRFEYFENLGADSIDGTGLSRYSHMREAIWRTYTQPNLLTVAEGRAPAVLNAEAGTDAADVLNPGCRPRLQSEPA